MNRSSQFFRNVSSNYAVAAVHGLLFVLVTPLVVRTLGVEHYAVWVIVQTLGYFLGFLDFGLSDAQVRQHARLAARGEHAAIGRLHGTALTLFAAAGLAAVVLAAVIAALPSASLLDIPDTARDVYGPVLLLIGLLTALSFIDQGLDGVFEGHQRFDIRNAIDLVLSLLEAALVVVLLLSGHGLLALAAARVAAALVGVIAKAIVIRRAFPAPTVPVPGFDRPAWRSVRGYTLWNSLNELATEGTAHLDKLIIPVLLTSALVTPYSLVVAVAAVIFLLAEPITDTFLPIASHRHGREDRVGIATLLTRGTRLVMSATLPAALVVLFFGHAVLDHWIGEEYTDLPAAVLWFTAGNFLVATFLWTPLLVLMGAGEIRRVFRLSVLEVTLALVLILSLVPPLGLPGLALAGLLANVAVGLACFVPAACRLAGLSVGGYLLRGLVLPTVALAPAAAVAWQMVVHLPPDSWARLLAGVGLTGLAAVACTLAFSLTRRERRRHLVTLRRLTGLGYGQPAQRRTPRPVTR